MAPIAEEMKALVEDIQASARERMRTLAEFLTDCREERQTRAREIRTLLADAEADRLRAFQEMHDRVTGRVRELADETRSDARERMRTLAEIRTQSQSFLADCREEREDMGKQLRADLADAEADRMRAFQEMHERVTGRVRELADETRSDMQEAHGAWQGLAASRSGA